MKISKAKKLNIIFLDFDDITNPLLNAGQARATLEVGKRLILLGHQLTVICSKFPGYKDRIDPSGIKYEHIGWGTKNIRLNNLIYVLVLPLKVMRLKTDIIVECFAPPFSTLFTPLFTKVPTVGLPTSFEAERFSKLYHLPFYLVERFGCRLYKYFLPYTDALDEKMKKVNPKVLSRVVPEGVGEEYFQIKAKKPEYILFLGRFDIGQKGIDILLQAYALVKDRINWPLVIAGKGPDELRMRKIIKSLDLEDKVTVLGPLYGQEKYEVLSKAICVAFPSRHEGFSLFSLEALASGLPLITFDIPGLSWADSKIVAKAPSFDVEAYAELLLEANDQAKIKQLRSQGRELARKFTWDKVAKQFEGFFEEVLQTERESNL